MVSETLRVFAHNVSRLFPAYLLIGLATSAGTAVVSLWVLGSPWFDLGFSPVLYGSVSPADLVDFSVAASLVTIIAVCLSAFLAGGVARFTVQYRRGLRESFRTDLARGLVRSPIVIAVSGAAILVPQLAFLLPFWIFTTVAKSQDPSLLGLTAVVLFGTLLFSVYVAVTLSLSVPSVMMEDLGWLPSLRRSWNLTVGSRGVIFGSLLLVAILTGIVTFLLRQPAIFSGSILAYILADAVAHGIAGSWTVIAVSVVYDDIVSSRPGMSASRSVHAA